MSVITMSNRRGAKSASNRAGGAAPTIREQDEFEGFWVNIGPNMPDGNFARLNRGIAVSDLQIRQIYETTDPQRKAELTITNAVVRAIQSKANAKKLAEGEFIVLKNLQVVLYRRMEGSEGETTASLDAEVEALLFGEDDDTEAQDPQAKPAAEDSDAAFEAEVERRMAERLAAQSTAGQRRKSAAQQLMDDEDDKVLGTTK